MLDQDSKSESGVRGGRAEEKTSRSREGERSHRGGEMEGMKNEAEASRGAAAPEHDVRGERKAVATRGESEK